MSLADHTETSDCAAGTIMANWTNVPPPVPSEPCYTGPTAADRDTVVCSVYQMALTRGANLPRTSHWGSRFRAPMFYTDAANNANSVLSVVAGTDGTGVTVTDGIGWDGFQVVDLWGNPTDVLGQTWPLTLDAGWVVQFRNLSPAATIATVDPNKLIQVVAWNNECGWMRGMDLLPESGGVTQWGTSYRMPAFWADALDNQQSVVSVVAGTDDTMITVQDGPVGSNGFQVYDLYGLVAAPTGQTWTTAVPGIDAGWVIQFRNLSPGALITSGKPSQAVAWNNEYGWVRGMSLRSQALDWGTSYRAPEFWADAYDNASAVLSVVVRDTNTTVTVSDGPYVPNGYQTVDAFGTANNRSGTWQSGPMQPGWVLQVRNASPAALITANKPIQVVAWNNQWGRVRSMNLPPQPVWGTNHRSPAWWADPANNQGSIISVVAAEIDTQVWVADGGFGGNGFQVVDLWGGVTDVPAGTIYPVTLQPGWVVQVHNSSPATRVYLLANKPIQVVGWNSY